MKINVVGYLDSGADSGGGGRYRRALVEEGLKRGHKLRFTHVLPISRFESFPKPDLWLLWDVWNSPWHWSRWWRRASRRLPGTIQSRYRRTVGSAVASGRMIHMDNAYVDICDLDYLPCSATGDQERCPFKSGVRADRGRCFRTTTRSLYSNALLRFYLSPLHRNTIERFLRVEGPGRPELVRPVIDTTRFAASSTAPRPVRLLFLGSFVEAKGANEVMRRWPSGEVTVVGPPTAEARRYSGYTGPVAYEDVPVLLSHTETLVCSPRWPEPYGLVVLEAALSGCRLESNERVGALSFGADGLTPGVALGSAREFWERLEELDSC
jgi:glycosyltransferase involved in cell wall biosynthesis